MGNATPMGRFDAFCTQLVNNQRNLAMQRLYLMQMQQMGGFNRMNRPVDQIKQFNKNVNSSFDGLDMDGDNNISREEYEFNYLRQKEREQGGFIDPRSKDYQVYKREANRMFDAISQDGQSITKHRYQSLMKLFDKADGAKDGVIDGRFAQEAFDLIKRRGPEARLTGGRTLRELLDMQG